MKLESSLEYYSLSLFKYFLHLSLEHLILPWNYFWGELPDQLKEENRYIHVKTAIVPSQSVQVGDSSFLKTIPGNIKFGLKLLACFHYASIKVILKTLWQLKNPLCFTMIYLITVSFSFFIFLFFLLSLFHFIYVHSAIVQYRRMLHLPHKGFRTRLRAKTFALLWITHLDSFLCGKWTASRKSAIRALVASLLCTSTLPSLLQAFHASLTHLTPIFPPILDFFPPYTHLLLNNDLRLESVDIS